MDIVDLSESEWPDAYSEQDDWTDTIPVQKPEVEDFIFMTLQDVENQFPLKLHEIMDTLALTTDEAITALRHFHWNSEKLKE